VNILLISDIPPGTEYPAGLFLYEACKALAPVSISGVFITHPKFTASLSPADLFSGRHLVLSRPREQLPVCERSALLKKLSYGMLMKLNEPRIERLVLETVEFARKTSPDLLWGVMAGQTQLRVIPRVAEELGIDLVTLVLDPPEYELQARGADSASRRTLTGLFARTLKRSNCCVTVSLPMAEHLARQYGVCTEVCYPGLPESLALPPRSEFSQSGRLIIGICGRIYALDAWRVLLESLAACQWNIAGRTVEIHVMSRHGIPNDPGEPRVRNLGWSDQAETVRRLSDCDILYCPYWLDPRMETVTRFSFPSKLTTYLASGRPVLFHGPAFSSVWEFLNASGRCGLCTDSTEPAGLAAALEELAVREDLRMRLATAGSNLFRARLTDGQFRKGIRKAFGIPGGDEDRADP